MLLSVESKATFSVRLASSRPFWVWKISGCAGTTVSLSNVFLCLDNFTVKFFGGGGGFSWFWVGFVFWICVCFFPVINMREWPGEQFNIDVGHILRTNKLTICIPHCIQKEFSFSRGPWNGYGRPLVSWGEILPVCDGIFQILYSVAGHQKASPFLYTSQQHC